MTISKQRIRSSARYIFLSTYRRERVILPCQRSYSKSIVDQRTEQSSITHRSMHSLAFKIRCEGAFPVWSVEKCSISVGTESTREDTDVTEYALEWYSVSSGEWISRMMGCYEPRVVYRGCWTSCTKNPNERLEYDIGAYHGRSIQYLKILGCS